MRSARGFTLIELMIAVSIVVILSVVGFVVFSNAQVKARDGKRVQDLQQIQVALEEYFQDHGYYPSGTTLTQLTDGSGGKVYLAAIPTDPKNDDTYKYIYTVVPTGCSISTTRCISYTLTDNSETNPTTANFFNGSPDSVITFTH